MEQSPANQNELHWKDREGMNDNEVLGSLLYARWHAMAMFGRVCSSSLASCYGAPSNPLALCPLCSAFLWLPEGSAYPNADE